MIEPVTIKEYCIFCDKPVYSDCPKPYHLDCFDTLLEKEFGVDALFNILMWRDHKLEHADDCPVCKNDNWINYKINQGAPEGKRHRMRWSLFVGMRQRNWSPEKISAALLNFNAHCNPPENENAVKYHIEYLLRRANANSK